MALDSFFIMALSGELNEELTGAKVVKILMPDKRKIVFQLYKGGRNRKLLFSIGSGSTRLYLTDAEFDNPESPYMFCMFLRKHLTGAVIEKVEAVHCERVMRLSLSGKNTFDERIGYTIVVEMLGKVSNFILLDTTDHIIDCLIRSGYSADYTRGINPGSLYRLPPRQEKTDLFETEPGEIEQLCASADRDLPAEDWLLGSFLGFSPTLSRELAYRAGGNYEELPAVLQSFRTACETGGLTACICQGNGTRAEVSAYALTHKGTDIRTFPSFSEALEAYYSQKEQEEYRSERSRNLLRQTRSLRDRLARKIAVQTEELRDAENAEEIRRAAEFVTANIYALHKGDKALRCTDYYSEDQHEVVIPLDPLKTPQQNAAALYKTYSKKKTAARVLDELLQKEKIELDYIESVIDTVCRAENGRDLDEIRGELVAGGFLKPGKKEGRKRPASSPIPVFHTEDGFTVRVGKNNLQNEQLTFKLSRRSDLWFHVKNYHGSHVVLSCGDSEPSQKAIRAAASLAVRYSEADSAGKQAVDYTQIRNVNRRKGALPGMVYYTDYQTVLISGDEWTEKE